MKFYFTFAVITAITVIGGGSSGHHIHTEEKDEKPIGILNQEYDSGFDGTFTNNFETANGISFEQSGNVKTLRRDKEDKLVQEIVGSFSYTAPDGTPVKVDYIANEGGFQPQGAILPTAPPNQPLPVAIARAIKFIEEQSSVKKE